MTVKEIQEKIEAQKKHCRVNKVPNFAPLDGKCWNCGRQIYDRIDLEDAGSENITGCPYCHTSFCE